MADYSYTYDNGGADTALWSGLLSDVVQAGGNYAAQALGNRNNRNNLTVGPAPAPADNSGMMKWAMIGGGVLVAVLVLVMVLRKKGG